MPNVDPANPANETVLKRLGSYGRCDGRTELDYSSAEADYMRICTHPDLSEYLWYGNNKQRDPYSWVVQSRPALVHPNGVIYAFASGTSILAIRLPEKDRLAAIAQNAAKELQKFTNSTWQASEFGPDWVFLKVFSATDEALLKQALEYAGTLGEK